MPKPKSFPVSARVALALSFIASLIAWGPAQATTSDASVPPVRAAHPITAPHTLSADARHVWQWALESGDAHGQPFAVVDKKAARLYLFAADGQLLGTDAVLLGQAPGDHGVPGVADGDVSQIPLAHRTTPAGRFASQPGRNLSGEAIVWFDYSAALAIHRVRPGASQALRLQQIASTSPADNRASLGCVVVTPEFYDSVVQPVLGRQRGVVYVLPEREPAQAYFGRSPLTAQR